MAVTRNPTEFLRRQMMSAEPARPRPRLDVEAMLIHTIPLPSPPMPAQAVLAGLEGVPPPDRGTSRAWPGQLAEAQ